MLQYNALYVEPSITYNVAVRRDARANFDSDSTANPFACFLLTGLVPERASKMAAHGAEAGGKVRQVRQRGGRRQHRRHRALWEQRRKWRPVDEPAFHARRSPQSRVPGTAGLRVIPKVQDRSSLATSVVRDLVLRRDVASGRSPFPPGPISHVSDKRSRVREDDESSIIDECVKSNARRHFRDVPTPRGGNGRLASATKREIRRNAFRESARFSGLNRNLFLAADRWDLSDLCSSSSKRSNLKKKRSSKNLASDRTVDRDLVKSK